MASAEPRVRLDQDLAKHALDRALICMATYDREASTAVIGWKGSYYQHGSYSLSDALVGLNSGLYERMDKDHEREAVLVYRYTEPAQINDWINNFAHFAGLVEEVYTKGAKEAQIVIDHSEKNGVNTLSLTGHFLGGEIASYSAFMFNLKATCFGSAALRVGLQKVLWQEASPQVRQAENLVLYVFKNDDAVPVITAATGRHFGPLADPALRAPDEYNRIRSPEAKLAYLIVSVMISEKWLKSEGTVAMSHIMEGHGIDQYIVGLTNLIIPPEQFDPAGEWTSKQSFFDITSNESRFRFCRNGRFTVIYDFKFMQMVRQKTNDCGQWIFRTPNLHMTIAGVAKMTYVQEQGDGLHSIIWRRSSMQTELPNLEKYQNNSERDSTALKV